MYGYIDVFNIGRIALFASTTQTTSGITVNKPILTQIYKISILNLSYSCMNNVKSIIFGHNKAVTIKSANPDEDKNFLTATNQTRAHGWQLQRLKYNIPGWSHYTSKEKGISDFVIKLMNWNDMYSFYKWINKRSYIWTAENDMKTSLIIAVIHTTKTVVKLKPEKNSGFKGIRTHDLYNTVALLGQLSYQENWELVTLWVLN